MFCGAWERAPCTLEPGPWGCRPLLGGLCSQLRQQPLLPRQGPGEAKGRAGPRAAAGGGGTGGTESSAAGGGHWEHRELSCQKGVLVQGMGSFPSPSSPLHAQRARRPVGCTAASPAPASAQDHPQQRTPPSLSCWPGHGASVAAPCLSGVLPAAVGPFSPKSPSR